MQDTKAMRLSANDQQYLAQALLVPPQPLPALIRAFACRQRLLVDQTDTADRPIRQSMDNALADMNGKLESRRPS